MDSATPPSFNDAVLAQFKLKIGQDAGNTEKVKQDVKWARNKLESEWSGYSKEDRELTVRNLNIVAQELINVFSNRAATLAAINKIHVYYKN